MNVLAYVTRRGLVAQPLEHVSETQAREWLDEFFDVEGQVVPLETVWRAS